MRFAFLISNSGKLIFLGGCILLLTGWASPQPQFTGRIVWREETSAEMAKEPLCQNAWDARLKGARAYACSWVWADPLHPGAWGCTIIYEPGTADWTVPLEKRNCASLDQAVALNTKP